MAINIIQFVGLLLHWIGIIAFGGGLIWIKILMAKIENTQNVGAKLFFVDTFPTIFKVMNWMLLLLFMGGVIELITLNEPNLFGLPKTAGWVILTKVIVYVGLVTNSLLITERFVPETIETTSRISEDEKAEISGAFNRLERMLNISLLLIFIALVLGVITQML